MTKSQNRHKSWNSRLKSIEEFIEKHNRLPSQSIKEEHYNAKFLNLQKNKLKNNLLSQERAEFFTNLFNKHMHYFVPQSEKQQNEWQSRINSIALFIEKNNRLPKRFDKNESPDYEFLRTQRRKLKNNILLEKRIPTLKEFINKHQHFLRKTQTYWQSRLKSIEEFIEKHHRLPSRSIKEEKYNYNFLCTQRNRLQNNLLPEERIIPFKAFLKKYNQHASPKESFIARLKSIEAFIQKHKREPSHVIEEEMPNAKFLWRQKTKFKNNKLPQERIIHFKAFLSKCQQYFTK